MEGFDGLVDMPNPAATAIYIQRLEPKEQFSRSVAWSGYSDYSIGACSLAFYQEESDLPGLQVPLAILPTLYLLHPA